MALPAIDILRISSFQQRPNAKSEFTADGFPYVVENNTSVKHFMNVECIQLSATWGLIIADFEANSGNQFSFDDTRDNPATTRTVKYAGRPSRRQVKDGTLANTRHFITIPLVEV